MWLFRSKEKLMVVGDRATWCHPCTCDAIKHEVCMIWPRGCMYRLENKFFKDWTLRNSICNSNSQICRPIKMLWALFSGWMLAKRWVIPDNLTHSKYFMDHTYFTIMSYPITRLQRCPVCHRLENVGKAQTIPEQHIRQPCSSGSLCRSFKCRWKLQIPGDCVNIDTTVFILNMESPLLSRLNSAKVEQRSCCCVSAELPHANTWHSGHFSL